MAQGIVAPAAPTAAPTAAPSTAPPASEGPSHASDRPFERAALWLLDRGVHPNHLTFLQLPLYVFLILCAAVGNEPGAAPSWKYAFGFLNLLVPILDGGDGILARVGNLQSKTGAILDTTFDTLGIAIVMWGAAQFLPHQSLWIMLLFLGSIILFLQNALLEQKVIAYVRGPVLLAVIYPDPRIIVGCLFLASFITAWLILWRTPSTLRALGKLVPPLPPMVPPQPPQEP